MLIMNPKSQPNLASTVCNISGESFLNWSQCSLEELVATGIVTKTALNISDELQSGQKLQAVNFFVIFMAIVEFQL